MYEKIITLHPLALLHKELSLAKYASWDIIIIICHSNCWKQVWEGGFCHHRRYRLRPSCRTQSSLASELPTLDSEPLGCLWLLTTECALTPSQVWFFFLNFFSVVRCLIHRLRTETLCFLGKSSQEVLPFHILIGQVSLPFCCLHSFSLSFYHVMVNVCLFLL